LEPVDYSLAGGLAVYLSGTKPPPAYAELAWAKDTSWNEFLLWLAGNN
jgi:hypothetical protein